MSYEMNIRKPHTIRHLKIVGPYDSAESMDGANMILSADGILRKYIKDFEVRHEPSHRESNEWVKKFVNLMML